MLGYLIYLLPILLIVGIIAGIGRVFGRSRKIPSPAESEEAFAQLQKEVNKWKEEEIIDESQASRIIGRYLPYREERKTIKGWSKIVRIFSIFGAVLIGIGVILFIASNWGETPPWVNTLILILFTIGIYFVGWRLKFEKKTHPKIGTALIFLGSLLFGANLILISQIYHIRIEYSNLILVWALAILPLAYFTRSSLILGLSSVLTFSWGIFSLFSQERFYYFSQAITFPLAYYLSLFLILGIIVPLAYRFKSRAVQSINVIETITWLGVIASMLWFAKSDNPVVDFCLFLLLIGVIIFALGEIQSKSETYRSFGEIYYTFGLLLIFLTSFILTFPQVHQNGESQIPFLAILFNILLFGEICGAVYLGIQKRKEYFVNMGTVFFGLLILARYFSLSWSLGARAFAFILGGILLILGSYFIDKMRRKLIQKIRE